MLRLRLLELVLEVFLVISSRKQKSLNSVAFIVNVILKLVPYQLSGHQHIQDPGKAGNGGQGGHGHHRLLESHVQKSPTFCIN